MTCDGRRDESGGDVVVGCMAVAARGRDRGADSGAARSGAMVSVCISLRLVWIGDEMSGC